METAYYYLALSGLLTVLLWTPYILARMFIWGIPAFLHNYPEGFPAREPETPLWVNRAKRAHLNMVETMPAFIAVVVAAGLIGDASTGATVAQWAKIFFFARIAHAIVYILAIPALRTPVYLVSWAAILVIGAQVIL
ncbi:MAPEG family protein [Sphingorhabdus sp. Alg239-R122]|uniref:MAPEG family protein n=1 Tax=Sphingorhabdus sp. Alg239-R122 TaxID=2305989 RepID=UPI0013DAEE59|nr:MAPEG family protein [Sphingorhabdus sp. Alg239-R122]